MFKLVLKLHLNLKKLKTATFLRRESIHPPLDPSSRSFQLVSELWSPLLWFNHHWRKMDVSTIGSIRRRVPMLDREFYNAWKNEMLEIFNEYNLNKYITSPCESPINPLHPTPDEYLDMTSNLRTINIIVRGLPRNLLTCLPTFDCAYTIWRYLEERFPNYSLKNLDETLHKSIALNKMNTHDPNFDNCLFELRDLMRAKGDVGIISNIISKVIRIHRDEHCHC